MFSIKKDGVPTKDGKYLAFTPWSCGCKGGFFQVLPICDGHWNCSRNSDGSVYMEAEMTDITHWDYLPPEPEDE